MWKTLKPHQQQAVAAVLSFIAGAVLFTPTFAFAQAAVSGGVDFSGITSNAITALASVLGVVATTAVGFVANYFRVKTKTQDAQLVALLQDRIDDVITRAIDYASTWAKQQVADPNSPLKNVHFDNFFLEQAVKYVVSSIPDTISYLGLTTARIEDMIRSRLNQWIPTPTPNSGKLATVDTLPAAQPSSGLVVSTPVQS